MIFFTADLHFYHDNIIKHRNRPFRNADVMNEALIKKWNEKVKPSDEVYILGDFTLKGAQLAKRMLYRLNGKKYLVKGNHDKFVEKEEFDNSLFVWVKDYYELTYNNTVFVMFHYPIAEWNGFFKGYIHLHGHQHNYENYNFDNLKAGIKRYDVGVDANYMVPVSIDEIIEFFQMEITE